VRPRSCGLQRWPDHRVFATTNGSGKITDPATRLRSKTALTELKSVPQVSNVVDPYTGNGWCRRTGEVGPRAGAVSAKAIDVKGSSLDALQAADENRCRPRASGRVQRQRLPDWTCSPPNWPELIG